jgi:hypothetical protein
VQYASSRLHYRLCVQVGGAFELCRAALEGAAVVHFHRDDWGRQLLLLAADAGAVVSCDGICSRRGDEKRPVTRQRLTQLLRSTL